MKIINPELARGNRGSRGFRVVKEWSNLQRENSLEARRAKREGRTYDPNWRSSPGNEQQSSFEKGELRFLKDMKSGSLNKVYTAEVQGDGKGIVKVESEEQRNLSSFYNGVKSSTDLNACSMVRREALASDVDKILGVNLVPRTVLKDVPGKGVCSCQSFVEDFRSAAGPGGENIMKILKKGDIRTGVVFDKMIGSFDRHSGNFGFDRYNNLVLIDNGLSFANKSRGFSLENALLGSEKWVRSNLSKKVLKEERLRLNMKALDNKVSIDKAFTKYKLPIDERKAFWDRVSIALEGKD